MNSAVLKETKMKLQVDVKSLQKVISICTMWTETVKSDPKK